MIRNIITILVGISLIFSNSYNADASGLLRRKKSKEPQKTEKKKESPYDKFMNKKGMKTVKNSISIFLDGKDIFLEIPDSLIGRKFSINSYISESSDPNLLPGSDVSSRSAVFRIARTDSLLLFRYMAESVVVEGNDTSMAKAVRSSSIPAVAFASPIICRSPGGDKYVIKANDMFNPSDKNVIDLYALPFDGGRIYKFNPNSELSAVKDVLAFENSVSVVQEVNYKVDIVVGIFGVAAPHELSGEFVTTLSVLSDCEMERREADSRVGTRNIQLYSMSETEPVKLKEYSCRWDLKKHNKINIYVDTLISPSWRQAIKEGLEAWNPAFEKIDLGQVISVSDYPSDSTFSAMDPKISTVTLKGGSGRKVGARINTDYSTGEINRVNISVPGEYITGVRIASSTSIADVDKRYSTYSLSDEAVYDVLRAEVMSIFGQCLGLAPNAYGSMAYSPEQLRSPEFTRQNGITGSVTDNNIFNHLARPGDKEKGVVTIIDRIGKYDYYAIEWLYRRFRNPAVESDWLKTFISRKEGQDIYRFLPSSQGNGDPRALKGDLGNDPVESYNSGISHLKYAIDNAYSWLSEENMKEDSYRELYIEFVWLKLMDYTSNLCAWIGGTMSNHVYAGSSSPKYLRIPSDIQSKALKTAFSGLMDSAWMDNRELMDISGAYRTTTGFTISNLFSILPLRQRLYYSAMSCAISGSQYTPSKLLDDMHEVVFKGISSGKLKEQEDSMLAGYLMTLIRMSPVLKGNYQMATEGPQKNIAAEQIDLPALKAEEYIARNDLSSIPLVYAQGIEDLIPQYLVKAEKVLKKGKAKCKDQFTAGKIDYLLLMISRALNND